MMAVMRIGAVGDCEEAVAGALHDPAAMTIDEVAGDPVVTLQGLAP